MIETDRSVIYRGVILHNTFQPILATAWATLGPDADENDLRKYMIDNLVAEYPGSTSDQFRIVEFSWTEIDPMRVPHPVNLKKDR